MDNIFQSCLLQEITVSFPVQEKNFYTASAVCELVLMEVSYEQRSTADIFGLKERLPSIKNLQYIQ